MIRTLKFALIALIALTSANAWAQACDFDEDCLPDEICDAGFCAPAATVVVTDGCIDDLDCPGGFVCDAGVCVDGGTVVVTDGCVDDLDCPNGFVCDAGACVDGGTVVVHDPEPVGGTTVVAHSNCSMARGLGDIAGSSLALALLLIGFYLASRTLRRRQPLA